MAWEKRACTGSWPGSITPAARSPRSYSQSSAGPPRPASASSSSPPAAQLVLGLVATIKTINAQIKSLERQIATAMREHPDGQVFLSLFKKPRSVICAAELLAEIGDCRARYPTRDTLAADAGQAAVAKESGKHKAACFRWACNKRLRGAVGTLADSTRHHNPWAQDLYAHARQRGHDHPRAIRTLGRAWCRDPVALLAGPRRRMTRPATAPCNSTSPSPSPPCQGPSSTMPPPSAMLAGAIATGAAPESKR